MGKFGESSPVENIENIESGAENDVESPEIVSEKVSESSQEALEDGDNLLQNVSESMGLEEVEDVPGLLDKAKNKLAGVGERIQYLASSTKRKIKEVIVGKEIEDMTDEELLNKLEIETERTAEAKAHYSREIDDWLEKNEAGLPTDKMAKRSGEVYYETRGDKEKLSKEAKTRGLEGVDFERERIQKINKIKDEYTNLKIEQYLGVNLDRDTEINLRLAELESEAKENMYDIPDSLDSSAKEVANKIRERKLRESEELNKRNAELFGDKERYEKKAREETERIAEEKQKKFEEEEIERQFKEEKKRGLHRWPYGETPGYGGSERSVGNSLSPDEEGKPFRL